MRTDVFGCSVSLGCHGAVTLTKPQAIFVPVLFLLVFCAEIRISLRTLALVFIPFVLAIMPWLIRNYSLCGTPLLSTNGGIVLMIGNNPYATGGQIWDEKVKGMLGDLENADGFDVSREVQRETRARKIAIEYMLHNPVRTVMRWPRKITILYLSDVDGFYYSLGMVKTRWKGVKYIYWGLRAVAELYYAAAILLCIWALPTILRRKVTQHRIGLVLIAYFTLIYLVFFANARYHFALMFWVAIYSGVGGELVLTS